jgi:hypothetical protein
MICQLFGHRWRYGKTQDSPPRVFRTCCHCSIVQELKQLSPVVRAWVSMVQWTDQGARNSLGPFYRRQSRTAESLMRGGSISV